VTVLVRHVCASAREAEALRLAVAADNPAYLDVRADGRELLLRVVARSAASARTTLEDALACLKAAERVAGSARRP
jgi:hypothetical protein